MYFPCEVPVVGTSKTAHLWPAGDEPPPPAPTGPGMELTLSVGADVFPGKNYLRGEPGSTSSSKLTIVLQNVVAAACADDGVHPRPGGAETTNVAQNSKLQVKAKTSLFRRKCSEDIKYIHSYGWSGPSGLKTRRKRAVKGNPAAGSDTKLDATLDQDERVVSEASQLSQSSTGSCDCSPLGEGHVPERIRQVTPSQGNGRSRRNCRRSEPDVSGDSAPAESLGPIGATCATEYGIARHGGRVRRSHRRAAQTSA